MFETFFQDTLAKLREQAVIFLPITILIIGTALTAWSAYYVYQLGYEKDQLEFDKQVSYVDTAVQDYLETNLALLYAGRGFLNATGSISADTFRTYVSSYRLEQRFEGVQGIGYSAKLEPWELARVTAERRAEGAPNFRIYPEYQRQDYTSILYLYPESERNTAALGYDMFSEQVRQEAMSRARDTGQPALSAAVTLVQELDAADKQKGFLLYLPVYENDGVPPTVAARRDELEGYLYSVFRARDFFEGVFQGKQEPQVSFVVYDGESLDAEQAIYDSRTESSYTPLFTQVRPIEVGEHTWMVSYTNDPALELRSERHLVPYVILVGVIATMILFSAVHSQIHARIRSESAQLELLRSQRRLQESEEQLRLLVEGAHDYAIIFMDVAGYVQTWNEGAEHLFGYTEDEVLGEHFSLFYPKRQRKSKPARVLNEVLSKGFSQHEKQMQRKDGRLFWSSGTLTALYDENDNLRGIAKISRDVTARKRHEEKLKELQELTQSVLNSLSSHIAVINTSGEIIAINQAWEAFAKDNCGENDIAGLGIGSNYFTVLEETIGAEQEEARQVLAGLQAVVEGEVESFSMEYPCHSPTEERWYMLQASPLKTKDGGLVISHTNITQRRILERQKEEFLSIASHELKTPLTSIKAYTQVLEKFFQKRNDEKAVPMLQKMDKQINNMTTLVSDLLDVTKIQAGKLELKITEFNLCDLISETVELVQLTADDHSIEITGITDTCMVKADRERVGQVITNFLTNAVKYSPDGKKVIVTLEEEGDDLVVSVQDFGIGIPEEQRSALFKRFSRLQGERYMTFSGLGLGLYISSELITRMHGTIGVESVEDEGSTFYFTLPKN